jgi:hypothetical protein
MARDPAAPNHLSCVACQSRVWGGASLYGDWGAVAAMAEAEAVSPKAIARVLTSPAVVTAVRKELRRQTDYAATDPEVLGRVHGIIRGECL